MICLDNYKSVDIIEEFEPEIIPLYIDEKVEIVDIPKQDAKEDEELDELDQKVQRQKKGWEKQFQVFIDYIQETHTMYIRTNIGCWKIFSMNNDGIYCLWHRDHYSNDMTLEYIVRGKFHKQTDIRPGYTIEKYLRYICEHDQAKQIIQDDYKKLPQRTKKQKKYYKQAKKRQKRKDVLSVLKKIKELENMQDIQKEGVV